MAVGSTFRLPGLQKYLSQNLTLDVEKLDRLGSGAIEDPKIAAMLSDNLLSAAGAYGLALQVMGQGKISSSLLPEQIRREKMWAEKTKWFVGAAALFMIGAAVPYGRWYWDNSQFNSQDNQEILNNITRVQSNAADLDGKWSKIESAGGPEKQRLLNAKFIGEKKDLWPLINTLIYNTYPQNAPDAQPELASTDPAVIKKVKRGDRNQILQLGQVHHYVSDMAGVLSPTIDLLPDSTLLSVIPMETGGIGGNGGGMGSYGGPGMSPTFGTPPAAGATPSKPERGFIITLKLTTPSTRGIDIIAKFNSALMNIKPSPEFPFEVRNARIVAPMKLREDQNWVSYMLGLYQAKEREKTLASTPGGAPGGGGGSPGGGYPQPGGMDPGRMPGAGGGYPGFSGGGGFPGPGGGFPGAGGGYPGGPPGITGAATVKIPDEVFHDPVTQEDMRDDTECIVVFALVVDPNPVVPAPGSPKTVALATPVQP